VVAVPDIHADIDTHAFDLLREMADGDGDLLSRVGRRYYAMTGRNMWTHYATARCLTGMCDGVASRMEGGWWSPRHKRCVLDAGHACGHVF
jgi:hypothetical protein